MALALLAQGEGRMNPKHEFTAGCRRYSILRQLFVTLCAATVLVVTCPGCGDSLSKPDSDSETIGHLPDISAFLTKPSDRFLVDIKEISRGHPLLGVNSAHPHGGAHVHFDNTQKRWPKGKDEPASYPAIFAVTDGVIGRIDTRFGLIGGNDRYGLDLI